MSAKDLNKKTPEERKLELLVELFNDGKASQDEVVELFEVVMNLLASWRQELDQSDRQNTQAIQDSLSSAIGELRQAQKGIKEEFDKFKESSLKTADEYIKTKSQELNDVVSRFVQEVTGMIPAPVDLSEIEGRLKEVEGRKGPTLDHLAPTEAVQALEQALTDEIQSLKDSLTRVSGRVGSINPRNNLWTNGSGKTMGKLTVSATQPSNPGLHDIWIDIS